MTIEDNVYAWLTHGYDKNGINWYDAMDRAKETLNNMDHVEFLKLISDEVEQKLLYKDEAK